MTCFRGSLWLPLCALVTSLSSGETAGAQSVSLETVFLASEGEVVDFDGERALVKVEGGKRFRLLGEGGTDVVIWEEAAGSQPLQSYGELYDGGALLVLPHRRSATNDGTLVLWNGTATELSGTSAHVEGKWLVYLQQSRLLPGSPGFPPPNDAVRRDLESGREELLYTMSPDPSTGAYANGVPPAEGVRVTDDGDALLDILRDNTTSRGLWIDGTVARPAGFGSVGDGEGATWSHTVGRFGGPTVYLSTKQGVEELCHEERGPGVLTAPGPLMGYCREAVLAGGWVGFTRSDERGIGQLYRRSPAGVVEQLTQESVGPAAPIPQAISPQGEVVLRKSDRTEGRVLVRSPGEALELPSTGRIVYEGAWYIIEGARVSRVLVAGAAPAADAGAPAPIESDAGTSAPEMDAATASPEPDAASDAGSPLTPGNGQVDAAVPPVLVGNEGAPQLDAALGSGATQGGDAGGDAGVDAGVDAGGAGRADAGGSLPSRPSADGCSLASPVRPSSWSGLLALLAALSLCWRRAQPRTR